MNTTTRPAEVVGLNAELGRDPEASTARQPQLKEAWGIAVGVPTQQRAAEAHCFGDCGKISFSDLITDEATGGLFACFEKTCPYERETLRCYGSAVLGGVPHLIHVRALYQP